MEKKIIPTDIKKKRNRLIAQEKKDILFQKWKNPSVAKSSKTAGSNNKKLKENIEMRKNKLKALAEANKKQVENDDLKSTNKPKVKVTPNNRGSFLVNEIPKPGPSRRINRVPTIVSNEEIKKCASVRRTRSFMQSGNYNPNVKDNFLLHNRSCSNSTDENIEHDQSKMNEVLSAASSVKAKDSKTDEDNLLSATTSKTLPKKHLNQGDVITPVCNTHNNNQVPNEPGKIYSTFNLFESLDSIVARTKCVLSKKFVKPKSKSDDNVSLNNLSLYNYKFHC